MAGSFLRLISFRRLLLAVVAVSLATAPAPAFGQTLAERRAAARRAAEVDVPFVPLDFDSIEDLLDDPLFSSGPLSPCDPDRRACFDIRFELLIQPEIRRAGFFEPPALRRRALEREIYRQLLMDRTPYRCERVGGPQAVTESQQRIALSFLVPLREAYESGLTRGELPAFAADPLNLTLSLVEENGRRAGRDVYGYLPERNSCWYAWQQLLVKQRWSLRVDPLEADVLSTVLGSCSLDRLARPTCLDADAEADAEIRAVAASARP